jgi:hypothetical protein
MGGGELEPALFVAESPRHRLGRCVFEQAAGLGQGIGEGQQRHLGVSQRLAARDDDPAADRDLRRQRGGPQGQDEQTHQTRAPKQHHGSPFRHAIDTLQGAFLRFRLPVARCVSPNGWMAAANAGPALRFPANARSIGLPEMGQRRLKCSTVRYAGSATDGSTLYSWNPPELRLTAETHAAGRGEEQR